MPFAFSIGPKGVINDWRRFKLESMDQENLPSAKKELLRQMSSPHKAREDTRANLNRKVEPTAFTLMANKYSELENPRFWS